MKAKSVAHVQQKHEYGCLIACIAMVMGWDYDKVVAEFHHDFNKSGTSGEFAKTFICDHGFSVIEKRGTGWTDIRLHNERMMVPFASVHIVCGQQFVDNPKHTHAFVMDGKGNIHDPDDKNRKVVPCYEVRHVMGFFKD
jgi:hypothetical protein